MLLEGGHSKALYLAWQHLKSKCKKKHGEGGTALPAPQTC